MIKKISIQTKLGWFSAFENKGKIFQIKFGKVNKQLQSPVLNNFREKSFSTTNFSRYFH